jgi:hypothetical protein
MHIYAFGSVCRGDISKGSDVDLLAIVEGFDARFDPDTYSIYSYDRVREIWVEGNPFAWHLSLESRLLFSDDSTDFLDSLGKPNPYQHRERDCAKFLSLFRDAVASLARTDASAVFDLSTVFLALRNFATCFSLGGGDRPDFSRHAAIRLGRRSLSIPGEAYQILERARILCTRGYGSMITADEVRIASQSFGQIEGWMAELLAEVQRHDA